MSDEYYDSETCVRCQICDNRFYRVYDRNRNICPNCARVLRRIIVNANKNEKGEQK